MARSRKSLRWALFGVLVVAAYLVYPTVDRFIELQNNNELLLTAMSLALVVLAGGLVGVLVRNLVRLIVDRKRGLLGSRLRTKLVFFFLALVLLPATVLLVGSAQVLKETVEAILRTPLEKLSDESGQIVDQWQSHFRAESLRVVTALSERGPAVYQDPVRLERWRSEHDLEQVRLYRPGVPALDVRRIATARPQGGAGEAELGLDDLIDRVHEEGRARARIAQDAEGLLVQSAIPVPNPAPHGESASTGVVAISQRLPEFVSGSFEGLGEALKTFRRFRLHRKELVRLYLTSLGLIYLATLLIATWMGFYLTRRITTPIQQMASATREIAAGNLDVRVQSDTGDEVGMLVESFNEMAAQLQESREVITRSTADLRHTNQALDERRRYIETLIENLSTGVLSLDPNGRITMVNAAIQGILGISLHAGDVLVSELRSRGLNELADFIAPGEVLAPGGIRRELTIDREGSARQLSVRGSPLVGATGDRVGVLLVLEDLSDLVQAERAAAWREVARRIAHEIKNPLTPIQLSAQRLRKKFDEDPEQLGKILPEATAAIEKEVAALKSLVDEFSRFARLPEIQPREAEVRALVDSVRRLYESVAGIAWNVDVDPNLGEVRVDPQQMRRVLINLVDNSIAAMDARGTIQIQAGRHGDSLRIVVADDGPGIPPGDRDKMFAPYFSTKKRGTGLGLAIVHKVVTDHQGTIHVEDNRPRGARFVIEIPI